MVQRLKQLDEEVTILTADVKDAWDAYERTSAARLQAALDLAKSPEDTKLQLLRDEAEEKKQLALRRHEGCEEDKKDLLEERQSLYAKLLGKGEPLSCSVDSSSRHC